MTKRILPKSAPQGPAARRSNSMRAAGLALMGKRAVDNYGAVSWDDLNRQQYMKGPSGGINRNGWLAVPAQEFTGALHGVGGALGYGLGWIPRALGNASDAMGFSEHAGDMARAAQMQYYNLGMRGLHDMRHPLAANNVGDYFHGSDNRAIDRHNPLKFMSDDGTQDEGEWQQQINSALAEGGKGSLSGDLMAGLANASRVGNFERNVANEAAQWTLGAGEVSRLGGAVARYGGKKLLEHAATKALKQGARTPRFHRLVSNALNPLIGGNVATRTANKLIPAAGVGARVADAAGAVKGVSALGGERALGELNLINPNSPEAQEAAALSPQQKQQLNSYVESQLNDTIAAHPGATAQEARGYLIRNALNDIGQNGWRDLAPVQSTRTMNYLADSGKDFSSPEQADNVGAADQLSHQWMKHLEPQLAGEYAAATQSGNVSPELQARIDHYQNAARHNIIGTMHQAAPQNDVVDHNFIKEFLPEQHRQGYSDWMSGKAGPSQELVDSLHDIKAHYNVASQLGWNKALPKATGPIDATNLWKPAPAPAPAPAPIPEPAPPPGVDQMVQNMMKKSASMPRIYSRLRPHTIKQWLDKVAGTTMGPPTPPGYAPPTPAASPSDFSGGDDGGGASFGPETAATGPSGPPANPAAPATPAEQQPTTPAAPIKADAPVATDKGVDLSKLPPPSADPAAPPQGGTAAPPGGGAPTTPGTSTAPPVGQQTTTPPGTPGTPNVPGQAAPGATAQPGQPAAPAIKLPGHVEPQALEQMHAQVTDDKFIQRCKTDPGFFANEGRPAIEKYMNGKIIEQAEKDAAKQGKDFKPEEWAAKKHGEIDSFLTGNGNLASESWNTAMETFLKDASQESAKTGQPPPQGPQDFMAYFSQLWEGIQKGDPESIAKTVGLVLGIPAVIGGLMGIMGGGGVGSWITTAIGGAGLAFGAGMMDGFKTPPTTQTQPGGAQGAPAAGQPNVDNMTPAESIGQFDSMKEQGLGGPPANGPAGAPSAAPGAPGATPAPGAQPGAQPAPDAQVAPSAGPALDVLRNPKSTPQDIQAAGRKMLQDPNAVTSMPPDSPDTVQMVQRYAQTDPQFQAKLDQIRRGIKNMGSKAAVLLFGAPKDEADLINKIVSGARDEGKTVTPDQAKWLVTVARRMG